MRRTLWILLVLVLAALACNMGATTSSPTPIPIQSATAEPTAQVPVQQEPSAAPGALTADQIETITQAAVQIVAAQRRGGSLDSLWTGSGTIISPTGEIVTNCHVACGAPVLVILLTTDPDRPPEPRYLAEVTHYDELLDLALLQVVSDMDGNPVSPTNLPFLPTGDSSSLRLGDRLYIFGYPGVGGDTITFTTGAVSGFESATVAGQSQRVIIKTDAEIASGNSGGTAVDLFGRLVAVPTSVNSDVREGVTLGGLGILRPVNLINAVRQQPGTPPTLEEANLPPSNDPDPYEPNDTLDTAHGPLAPGQTIIGYISWPEDADVFWFDVQTTNPIRATLQDIPFGADYDLYLLDRNGEIVAASESETPQELIEYVPVGSGRYFIAVISYRGSSTTQPYRLDVTYDGGAGSGPPSAGSGGIVVTGRVVDARTGRALPGGLFGVLRADVTCNQFFGGSSPNMSLVVAMAETTSSGGFTLNGVPRGGVYPVFFALGDNYICENGWLTVPADAIDSDLGDIEVSF